MTRRFACPFLRREVDLTDEREAHILTRHPELTTILHECVGATLADPDEVRQSLRVGTARVFVRRFDAILSGKHVAVVVMIDARQARDWIVTAYVARRLSEGSMVWKRG